MKNKFEQRSKFILFSLLISGMALPIQSDAARWYSACWARSSDTGEVICSEIRPGRMGMRDCRDFASASFLPGSGYRYGYVRNTDEYRLTESLRERGCEHLSMPDYDDGHDYDDGRDYDDDYDRDRGRDRDRDPIIPPPIYNN